MESEKTTKQTTPASVLLNGHRDSVYDVVWSADGKTLASAGRDCMLRVWDASGAQLNEFKFSQPVATAAFSHDGRLLAVGTSERVEVRELPSAKLVFQRDCQSLQSLLFFRNDDLLLVGSGEGLVQGWSLTGKSTVRYSTGKPVFTMRAAVDGTWLAIACRSRILFLSDFESGPLAVFEAGETVDANDCVIAPDGETCAAALRVRKGGSIGHTQDPDLFEIALWRPLSGEEPLGEESLVGHIAWVTSVEFSPDSELLASASFDGSVRLWDYIQLRQVAEFRGHGAAVYAAHFSPSGDRLATCSADGTIRIWSLDMLTQRPVGASLVIREPFSPRHDGVGMDPLLRRAEILMDQLVLIDSPKRLQETIEATVQATDSEFGQTLLQIGNVRAEQARRAGDESTVRRWRMVQTSLRMRPEEFMLGGLLMGGELRKEDDQPSLLRKLASVKGEESKTLRQSAAGYEEIIAAVAAETLSGDEARRRLARKPLDSMALFLAAAKLQFSLQEVIAGSRAAVGMLRASEVLASMITPSIDPVAAAVVFDVIGTLYCLSDDNPTGVLWLERAVLCARHGGWHQQLSGAVGNLGNALRNVGRWQDARAAYEECLQVALLGGLHEEFLTHSPNLAIVYQDLGDFQSAFLTLRRAVGVCRYVFRALALVDAAETTAGGSTGSASNVNAVPLQFARVPEHYARCLQGLGSVYQEFGDDAGETDCYEEVYAICTAMKNRRGIAACLGNLAALDLRHGRNQRAEERYFASHAIALELNNADGQVHTLAGLSTLRRQAGLLAEAETLQKEAARLAREHGLCGRLIVALCDLASILQERGRASEAEAALVEAEQVATRMRRELRTADEGPKVQQYVAKIAHSLILLYLRSGRPVEAFETAERARAGIFIRQLSGQPQRAENLFSVSECVRALRRVGTNVVLVSYYVLPDRVCSFVLRADEDEPHSAEVSVSRDELDAVRRDFERQVVRRFARVESDETWLRISKVILDPVTSQIREGDLVLMAPHGPLQGLPLHALKLGAGRLIDKAAVAYIPSASAVGPFTEKTLPAVRTCSVLGAHFTQEAKQVAEALEAESTSGEELDKQTVLDALANRDVVHLSTHGFYVKDSPRRSGLVLRPSTQTDAYLRRLTRPLVLTWVGERMDLEAQRDRMRANILDSDDLASIRSQARLVTLSACETGLVHTDAADDPVGLVPTLLAIGVRGVVATLWLVDAETTAALMHEFYTALKRPGGWDRIPYALREAVNTIRRRYPHPYNWAPVLLVGGIGRGKPE
jgi:CHAT domain-containing protein/WD40 repeat protein